MLGQILKKNRNARGEPAIGVAADERIYAVGDVHGRADLLLLLLERIFDDLQKKADHRRPRLVFLGDYIDRGDQSARVLDTLLSLQGLGSVEMTFLMGNHEAALLSFLSDSDANPDWLEYGALQTLGSYGVSIPSPDPDRVQRRNICQELRQAMGAHVDFLRGLENFSRSGDVVFVHAGLSANTTPEEDERPLLWGTPGFLTEQPVPGVRVVHGHYDDPDPVSLPGRICVDTGAYYSGVLTAVRLDEGETFLSTRGEAGKLTRMQGIGGD